MEEKELKIKCNKCNWWKPAYSNNIIYKYCPNCGYELDYIVGIKFISKQIPKVKIIFQGDTCSGKSYLRDKIINFLRKEGFELVTNYIDADEDNHKIIVINHGIKK